MPPVFFKVALDLQQNKKTTFKPLKKRKKQNNKKISHIASPKGAMCTTIMLKTLWHYDHSTLRYLPHIQS
jgi:hypothetical protein